VLSYIRPDHLAESMQRVLCTAQLNKICAASFPPNPGLLPLEQLRRYPEVDGFSRRGQKTTGFVMFSKVVKCCGYN
jgi:hypothetical protein